MTADENSLLGDCDNRKVTDNLASLRDVEHRIQKAEEQSEDAQPAVIGFVNLRKICVDHSLADTGSTGHSFLQLFRAAPTAICPVSPPPPHFTGAY
jgi:hypothetical protein